MAQFFKGRISQTWTAIQQSEYSKQNQRRINNTEDSLPKHYSGNWWAANLIKQVVFMSLNMWQIRNDTLHADKLMADYNTQRRSLHIQTEHEFEQADSSKYLHRPYLERLTDPNHLLQAWCVTMERLHKLNEHRREITLGRDMEVVDEHAEDLDKFDQEGYDR